MIYITEETMETNDCTSTFMSDAELGMTNKNKMLQLFSTVQSARLKKHCWQCEHHFVMNLKKKLVLPSYFILEPVPYLPENGEDHMHFDKLFIQTARWVVVLPIQT